MSAIDPFQGRSILIVGAGTSGAVLAKLLAEGGWSVTMIDRYRPSPFKVGETLQGSTLIQFRAAGLEGILEQVPKLRCVGNHSIWGSKESKLRPAISNPYGGGWHVDRAAFDARLIERALEAGVHYISPCRIARSRRRGETWRVELLSGDGIRTCEFNWIVDASGRVSAFARDQGAKRLILDRLVGVVGLLESPQNLDQDLTISIESDLNGWWYSARIPGGKRIAIYFTDADLLNICGARQSHTWWKLLAQTDLLGACVRRGEYALKAAVSVILADSSRLEPLQCDGWLAIGDAGAAQDPLSAAGISEAIRSASNAASGILGSTNSASDSLVGYTHDVLSRYSTYQTARLRYYGLEDRWPHSEFWRRRRDLPEPFRDLHGTRPFSRVTSGPMKASS
jgi:flavin-dependent dehydrogenase